MCRIVHEERLVGTPMSDYEFDVLKNREVPFQNRPLERAPAKIAVFLNKTSSCA